jgi:gamma-glutamylcyclotransferase (GGCT)/AIG2-like uncharacterized protein YtfP
MQAAAIIAGLNQKKSISHITLDTLHTFELTEDEKDFIKTHKPEKALIIYGSLAPGKPNHSKMESIQGEWKAGVVKGGKLESKGWGAKMGFNGFVPASSDEQSDIPAQVIFSDQLVAHWAFLDEFEGEGYRRILARYELENGESGVGYIYAVNEMP